MNLKNLIQTLNLQAETAASIATALNSKTVTITDARLFGPAKLRKALTTAQNNAVSTALATKAATDPVVADLLTEFRAVGVDFSDPDVRAIFSALGLSTVQRNKVLEIGIYQVSPWFNATKLLADVTDAEVNSALLEIRKDSLIDSARDTFEAYRVTVNEWNGVGNPPLMGG